MQMERPGGLAICPSKPLRVARHSARDRGSGVVWYPHEIMPAVAARFAPFVILTLIAAGCAIGPARLSPSPEVPTPVRQVLPNGVRVIVQGHRGSDVTALQLWVRAGGRDEA